MLIFSGRKKITVDAFTCEPGIHEYFPIQLANKFMPDWWKTMPSFTEQSVIRSIDTKASTLKMCDGLISLYKNGFIIPLWSDLIIKTFGDGAYEYLWASPISPGNSTIDQHHSSNFKGTKFNSIHIKIISPWVIKEKHGVKFIWMQPSWSFIDHQYDAHILPGSVEYKQNTASHINMFFKMQDKQIELSAGQPVAHIIPISEKKVQVKNHIVSPIEYDMLTKRLSYTPFFSRNYKKLSKINADD